MQASKEHRLLVFSDPAKDSATSRTVDCLAALARLAAAGVETPKEDTAYVATLRGLRNRLEHGAVSLLTSAAETTVGRAFNFLERFCSAELGISLEDKLPRDSYFVAHKAGLDAKEAYDLAEATVKERMEALPQQDRSKHEVLECPFCGNMGLIYPNPDLLPRDRMQCYFCHQWQKYPDSFLDPFEHGYY